MVDQGIGVWGNFLIDVYRFVYVVIIYWTHDLGTYIFVLHCIKNLIKKVKEALKPFFFVCLRCKFLFCSWLQTVKFEVGADQWDALVARGSRFTFL